MDFIHSKNKWSNMEESRAFNLDNLHIIKGEDFCTNYIHSIEDSKKLNNKIEMRIQNYRLDALLLKIHDTFLAENKKHNEFLPETNLDFIAGMMTKYAILNCSIYNGFAPIYDEEISVMFRMIAEYSIYDPEFEKERQLGVNQEERLASLMLRKIGNQVRWDIRYHNILGRTLFLYSEMIKDGKAPTFIKELVNHKFEEKFGLTLIDFIKIGFVLFTGSLRPGGMNREHFEIARMENMLVPNDEIVKKCLEQIACDTDKFKKICNEELIEKDLHAYKFNPLLKYPIIRPWKNTAQGKPKDDKFLAPVPNLVLYRFTTGLYFQLFDIYKEDFSKAFGELFEKYVGDLFVWCKLPGKVLTENDIMALIPKYKGKKPDYVIFCEEGIIFIECKATLYSQDMYEHGLKATKKSCIDQITKAIKQMNEFENQLPLISKLCGVNNTDLKVRKVIISFDNFLGLNEGPFRNWIDRKINEGGIKIDWQILGVEYLEEAQPYLTKGADFLSFLLDMDKKPINKIIEEMKSKTGASYADSILFKYQNTFFNELTKNGELLKN